MAEVEDALKQITAFELELRAQSDELDARFEKVKLSATGEELEEFQRQGRKIQIELEQLPVRIDRLLRLQREAEIREAPAKVADLYSRFRKLLPEASQAKDQWLALREELNSLVMQLRREKSHARDGKLKCKSPSEKEFANLLEVLDLLGPERDRRPSHEEFRFRVGRAVNTRVGLFDESGEDAQVAVWRAAGYDYNHKKGTLRALKGGEAIPT